MWLLFWPTLHLQVVQGELGIRHVSPLRRAMPAGSWHVCRMSYDRLSARQGSVTQRGQHSPSATAVYSHIITGQTRGQQSTSPSCRGIGRGRETKVTEMSLRGGFCVNQLMWNLHLQLTCWFVATSLIRKVAIIWAFRTQQCIWSGPGIKQSPALSIKLMKRFWEIWCNLFLLTKCFSCNMASFFNC